MMCKEKDDNSRRRLRTKVRNLHRLNLAMMVLWQSVMGSGASLKSGLGGKQQRLDTHNIGDPDIAGPGVCFSPQRAWSYKSQKLTWERVLGAFIATAWLTCLIAGLDAYCGISKSFNNYLFGKYTTDPNQSIERLSRPNRGAGSFN